MKLISFTGLFLSLTTTKIAAQSSTVGTPGACVFPTSLEANWFPQGNEVNNIPLQPTQPLDLSQQSEITYTHPIGVGSITTLFNEFVDFCVDASCNTRVKGKSTKFDVGFNQPLSVVFKNLDNNFQLCGHQYQINFLPVQTVGSSIQPSASSATEAASSTGDNQSAVSPPATSEVSAASSAIGSVSSTAPTATSDQSVSSSDSQPSTGVTVETSSSASNQKGTCQIPQILDLKFYDSNGNQHTLAGIDSYFNPPEGMTTYKYQRTDKIGGYLIFNYDQYAVSRVDFRSPGQVRILSAPSKTFNISIDAPFDSDPTLPFQYFFTALDSNGNECDHQWIIQVIYGPNLPCRSSAFCPPQSISSSDSSAIATISSSEIASTSTGSLFESSIGAVGTSNIAESSTAAPSTDCLSPNSLTITYIGSDGETSTLTGLNSYKPGFTEFTTFTYVRPTLDGNVTFTFDHDVSRIRFRSPGLVRTLEAPTKVITDSWQNSVAIPLQFFFTPLNSTKGECLPEFSIQLLPVSESSTAAQTSVAQSSTAASQQSGGSNQDLSSATPIPSTQSSTSSQEQPMDTSKFRYLTGEWSECSCNGTQTRVVMCTDRETINSPGAYDDELWCLPSMGNYHAGDRPPNQQLCNPPPSCTSTGLNQPAVSCQSPNTVQIQFTDASGKPTTLSADNGAVFNGSSSTYQTLIYQRPSIDGKVVVTFDKPASSVRFRSPGIIRQVQPPSTVASFDINDHLGFPYSLRFVAVNTNGTECGPGFQFNIIYNRSLLSSTGGTVLFPQNQNQNQNQPSASTAVQPGNQNQSQNNQSNNSNNNNNQSNQNQPSASASTGSQINQQPYQNQNQSHGNQNNNNNNNNNNSNSNSNNDSNNNNNSSNNGNNNSVSSTPYVPSESQIQTQTPIPTTPSQNQSSNQQQNGQNAIPIQLPSQQGETVTFCGKYSNQIFGSLNVVCYQQALIANLLVEIVRNGKYNVQLPLTVTGQNGVSASAIAVFGRQLGCTAPNFPTADPSITLQMAIQQLGTGNDTESFKRALIRSMNDLGVEINDANSVVNNIIDSISA